MQQEYWTDEEMYLEEDESRLECEQSMRKGMPRDLRMGLSYLAVCLCLAVLIFFTAA